MGMTIVSNITMRRIISFLCYMIRSVRITKKKNRSKMLHSNPTKSHDINPRKTCKNTATKVYAHYQFEAEKQDSLETGLSYVL